MNNYLFLALYIKDAVQEKLIISFAETHKIIRHE